MTNVPKLDDHKQTYQNQGRHDIICRVDIMSIKDYKNKKLNKEEARKQITKVAATGNVIFTSHALQRLSERGVIINDVMNVLLSNSMRVSEAEPSLAGFTYRCTTKRFIVVVSFTVRGDGIVVITVINTERRN
mgnify:FL=1